MKKLLTPLIALTIAVGIVGCGGTDNVETCKTEVGTINALDCTAEDFLDADLSCPDSYDETGFDYTDYFACTFGQYSCDEDGNLVTDTATCTLPTS